MSEKCCGQSNSQRELDIHTESKTAVQRMGVKGFVNELLGVYIGNLADLTDGALEDLSDSLRELTLAVTTEKAKRTGKETCCTSTLHDPVKVNIPGVGECSYTGD